MGVKQVASSGLLQRVIACSFSDYNCTAAFKLLPGDVHSVIQVFFPKRYHRELRNAVMSLVNFKVGAHEMVLINQSMQVFLSHDMASLW